MPLHGEISVKLLEKNNNNSNTNREDNNQQNAENLGMENSRKFQTTVPDAQLPPSKSLTIPESERKNIEYVFVKRFKYGKFGEVGKWDSGG